MSQPTSAGDILGGSAIPLTITFRGKTHTVSPPTLAVLDRVEKLVAMQAAESIREQAEYMPPEWVKQQEDKLGAMLRVREHRTGGKLWQEAFEADGGLRALQLMLFACLEEARAGTADQQSLPPPIRFESIPDLLAESAEAGTVANLLLPDFFRAAAKRRKASAAAVEQAIEKARQNQPS